MSEVTQILNAIEGGDQKAADELLPLVYEELRRLAAHKMSRQPSGQTLQATALVHEAYIRLVGSEAQNWSSQTHLSTAAAEVMRWILIENARRKRGGGQRRVEIDDAELPVETPSDDLIALDCEKWGRLPNDPWVTSGIWMPIQTQTITMSFQAFLLTARGVFLLPNEEIGASNPSRTQHHSARNSKARCFLLLSCSGLFSNNICLLLFFRSPQQRSQQPQQQISNS